MAWMGQVDGSVNDWCFFIEVNPEEDKGLKFWVYLVPCFWHWKLCNAKLEYFEQLCHKAAKTRWC